MTSTLILLLAACGGDVDDTTETETATPTEWTVQRSSSGGWLAVAAGFQHTCAISADRTVSCWGRVGDVFDEDPLDPPEGEWDQIRSNQGYSCAMTDEGLAKCWGDNEFGKARPPIDNYSYLGLGYGHACGVIASDQSATCWGWAVQDYPPPVAEYLAIDVGYHFTISLYTDGSLYGWGFNYDGQATPPSGVYSDITAGGEHACAMTSDLQTVCWGGNDHGQSDPPDIEFTQVDGGDRHTCAIDTAQNIHCWGDNSYGQSSPPSGEFEFVSAGGVFNCAIDTDGYIHCWGWNTFGEASPP